MENIELRELMGGALQEQFAKAFERVIDNLQNPNTPYKAMREITVKLKFTQNEQRDDVKCNVSVTEKLAAHSPMETSFAIGKDLRTGEVFAKEYGKQVRGQLAMDMETASSKVDTETGEIMNDQAGNVVDLRKAASK